MKKQILSCVLLISALYLQSCTKSVEKEAPLEEIKSATPEERETLSVQDPSKVFVEYVNGQYVTSYQGGLTFGPTLPHPIDDPTGVYDGYQIPTIEFLNWTLNAAALPYTLDGAYFSMLQPTFPSSGITGEAATISSIETYHSALYDIWQNATLTHTQKVQQANAVATPTITAVASGGGEVKRVSGLLIRDHESPTKMSVVNEKYMVPTVTGTDKIVGVVNTGGYRIDMFAPSSSTAGPVTRVTVEYLTSPRTVASYNITYSGTWESYHTVGTLTLSNGTVFNINHYLEP
ncbi:hypothetical protein [Paraflavitalea sp. CAU 1676]|uniref:hypothetical protein n=1 Tax=Paraflavitalea sp. CAU 1676 TaxID=3032598 RepID=UPI0023DBFA34|nr:hypothetical protein [Paraflavitalea sp. CAU 1676]MDF2191708.1 hypothetical protein [Paraflavitalea sp. CAU 1676]